MIPIRSRLISERSQIYQSFDDGTTAPFDKSDELPPKPQKSTQEETKEPNDKQLSTLADFLTINRHLLPAKIASFLNLARFATAEYILLFYISVGK